MTAVTFTVEHLLHGLDTQRIGRRIDIRDTVDSTNRTAWTLTADADADGTVVLAEFQRAGRGRLGREWRAPRGASVLMSVILVGSGNRLDGEILPLLTAVAAVDAVRAATKVNAEIKWPNDLKVDGRKLGGILIEARKNGRIVSPTLDAGRTIESRREPNSPTPAGESPSIAGGTVYVVGIGINCLHHRNHFPPELRETATSLELESPGPVDRTAVTRSLLIELDRWLAAPESWDAKTLHDAWVQRAQPLGQRIRLRQNGAEFSGHVVDIDPVAGLLVQLDQGGRRLFDAASTSVVE